jgi:hypothetical protein
MPDVWPRSLKRHPMLHADAGRHARAPLPGVPALPLPLLPLERRAGGRGDLLWSGASTALGRGPGGRPERLERCRRGGLAGSEEVVVISICLPQCVQSTFDAPD